MVVLLTLNVFSNTMMIQNNKTIKVLGCSYDQQEITSEIIESQFKEETSEAELPPFITKIFDAILQPLAKAEQSTATSTAQITAAKASNTADTTVSDESDYYVKTYRITHYCGCSKCNPGNAGMSASGKSLKLGMVAMRGVPFGTIVEINGVKYVVEDRCASSSIIDIYVSSHSEALQKGTYTAKVKIYK